MIVIIIFCVWNSHPQNFLNLLLFLHQFQPLCSYNFCIHKKCIISLAVMAVHGFLYKTVVANGWGSKMVENLTTASNAQVQIVLGLSNWHCVNMSVFGVILVRIFPHSDWIQRDREYLTSQQVNFFSWGNLNTQKELKFMYKRKIILVSIISTR